MNENVSLEQQHQRAAIALLEAKLEVEKVRLEVEKAQLRAWIAEADLREFEAEPARTYNYVQRSERPHLEGDDRQARKAALANLDNARARCVPRRTPTNGIDV